mgnify:CR=1 FL=1
MTNINNRLAFVCLFIIFFSSQVFSSTSDPDVTSTHRTNSTFDIGISSLEDSVTGCLNVEYQPYIRVTNYSDTFVQSVSVRMVSSSDTSIEKLWLSLEVDSSILMRIENKFSFDKEGSFDVNISIIDADDNDQNNSVNLVYFINPNPIVDFTISQRCNGDTVHFTSSIEYSRGDSLSYIWIMGEGDRSNSQHVKKRFNWNGEYEIQLTSYVANTGCFGIKTKKVTPSTVKNSDFTSKTINRTLTVLTVGHYDSTNQYLWEFGDGNRSNKPLPTHTYDVAGEYEVCLYVNATDGCIDTTCKLSKPLSWVSGRTFVDINNNCTFDSSDRPIETVIYSEDWNFTSKSNTSGIYKMTVYGGEDYVLHHQGQFIRGLKNSCNTDSLVLNNTKIDFTHSYDIIYAIDSGAVDLGVSLGHGRFIRGRTTDVSITIQHSNVYTLDDSLEVDFWYNPKQKVKWANVPIKNIKPGLARFKVNHDERFGKIHIKTTLSDEFGDLKKGESVFLKTQLVKTDNYPENDVDSSFAIVRSPYDPNAKTSYPENGIDKPIDKIRYIVQFQNIGNADAKDVVVYDYLDSRLDASSIRVTGTSHPEHFDMSIQNNLIKWTFKDIYLPDSASDPEGSQGFVNFEIDVAPSFKSIGDTIKNKAIIYFDFEDGIHTNVASIYFVDDASSIKKTASKVGNLKVYPNPTNSILTIENLSSVNQTFTILGINGTVIKSFAINGLQQINLDVSSYASGLYILMDEAGNALKFMKQ